MKGAFFLQFCLFTSALSCRFIATKDECVTTCRCAYCPVIGCFTDDDDKPMCFSGWESAPFTLECAKTAAILLLLFGICILIMGVIYTILWCWYRYQMKKLDAPVESFWKC